MAKRLSKEGKVAAIEYLLRLHNALENAESKLSVESRLEESLLLYELSAALTLSERFMTKEGAWMDGYDAEALIRTEETGHCEANHRYFTEHKKLKPVDQAAVETLLMIRLCRENIHNKNIAASLLSMQRVVLYSRYLWRKEEKIEGGNRDKRSIGLVEAVEQVRSSLKRKATPGTILRQFRAKHNSRKNALATVSGFAVYLSPDAKGRESFYIIDKRGKEDRRGLDAFIKTYVYKKVEDSNLLP